jgi:uncharacterized protein (TIGR03083 family)
VTVDAFAALDLEVAALVAALAGLSEPAWSLPTDCPPWRVRDLLAHVQVTIAWLPEMLAAPAPERAQISATEYYRPDARFDAATNARRIELAQDRASAAPDGAALLAEFAATWQQVERLCREQPAGRVVRTRHGDPMLLSEFLRTRVVEVAVHGIDLALALNRPPWTTRPAADLVTDLLLGPAASAGLDRLGWTPVQFIGVATGRTPIDAEQTDRLQRLGIHWLTLG